MKRQVMQASEQAGAARMEPSGGLVAAQKRVNRIKGQLDGVLRMLGEERKTAEVLQQIRAATNALRSLESEVVRGHLRGCVQEMLSLIHI